MIDFNALTSIDALEGEDEEETQLLQAYAERAREYLEDFRWCTRVVDGWFGQGVGDVFAVFLFKIEPAEAGVDEFLWVIIGDVPPAYLVTDDMPDSESALTVYIELMSEWVDAVREGTSLEGIIPVNAPPTREYAEMLSSRLDFLRDELF